MSLKANELDDDISEIDWRNDKENDDETIK
jgi:hypothetical protein